MTDQVSADTKAARAQQLAALGDRLRDRYYRSLRGRELQVLIEPRAAPRPGFLLGTACRYAPVEVRAEGARVREFTTIKAGDVVDGCIQGFDDRHGD